MQSVRNEWHGSCASDTALAADAAHLEWWGQTAYLGHNAQSPAKQGVRGVSPLSLSDRVKNARAAAKIKWNSAWGREWRRAYNASPKGRTARARYYGTSLFWSTLRRWRDANRLLVRSYEHRCREKYRANLKTAQAVVAAGASPVSLSEPLRRALARRAAEEKRETNRAANRKAARHSLKRAEADGLSDGDLDEEQAAAKRRIVRDKEKRKERKRLHGEAINVMADGRALTAEQKNAYDSLEKSKKDNRERNARNRAAAKSKK